MAAASFDLRSLAAALDRVSDDVKDAVGGKAQTAAIAMQYHLERTYPVGPRHLRKGAWVGGGALRRSVVRGQPGRFAVTSKGTPVPAAVVRVLAPHVHFYEEGTEDRFDPTRRNPRTGQPSPRGRAPRQGPLFVPTAVRERERMFAAAAALLNESREL